MIRGALRDSVSISSSQNDIQESRLLPEVALKKEGEAEEVRKYEDGEKNIKGVYAIIKTNKNDQEERREGETCKSVTQVSAILKHGKRQQSERRNREFATRRKELQESICHVERERKLDNG